MYEVPVPLRGRMAIALVEDHDIRQEYDDEGFPIGFAEIVFQYRVFTDEDEESAEVLGLTADERYIIYKWLIEELETICDDYRD
jgi:hypothetical protein